MSISLATLGRTQIAAISRASVLEMDHKELAAMVRSAGLPFLTTTDVANLPELGRKSLVKLGLMAVEFCQDQGRYGRWSALGE